MGGVRRKGNSRFLVSFPPFTFLTPGKEHFSPQNELHPSEAMLDPLDSKREFLALRGGGGGIVGGLRRRAKFSSRGAALIRASNAVCGFPAAAKTNCKTQNENCPLPSGRVSIPSLRARNSLLLARGPASPRRSTILSEARSDPSLASRRRGEETSQAN